jgi:hypothetical protein
LLSGLFQALDASCLSIAGALPGDAAFNLATQYISTKEHHTFIPLNFEATGQAQNAFENHGYIPRNGIGATITLVGATNEGWFEPR